MIRQLFSILILTVFAAGAMTSCQKNDNEAAASADFETKTVNFTVTGMT